MTYPSKTNLTDAVVAKFPLCPSGQKLIADTKQPGLYLKIGKTSKSWVVQREITTTDPETLKPKRQTIRRVLGDAAEMGVKEARDLAPEKLADIKKSGAQEKKTDVTLQEAWDLYRATLEKQGKSAATVYAYRNAVECAHLLGIWKDRPLSELATPTGMDAVATRHEKITRGETGKGGGSYAANGAMRTLRVIYNFARAKGYTPAPADPEHHPTLRVTYNPEEAREDAMSRLDLPGWWDAYLAMGNRVRAEFQLFLLLSGMRSGSLVDARWEDVDVRGRRLRVPAPKGGKAKAYDVPLTRPMLACLARARRAARLRSPNFADRIIFPGDAAKALRGSNSFTGHMSKFATKEPKLPCSGHGLRHTYRNACIWAGVEESLSKKLMNHSQKGDIHSGTYGSREGIAPDLLDAQERISATLMGLLRQQKEGVASPAKAA